MLDQRSSRLLVLVVVLGSAVCRATADEGETPSALERDPSGWTDLLSQAGPKLEGWTRGPIPPTGRLNPRSQWSLDTATGHLVCEGNGGHEWLRWDKELGDGIFHVEWRFTPVPGKKGYNSGIYAAQLGRRKDLAPGTDRQRLGRVPVRRHRS